MLDVLIRGGQIVDGTGRKAYRADVGLQGDRIALVGNADGFDAGQVVDAQGMLVTPGLIDPHSHSDWSILANPNALSTIHQGVTTEVVGNCGVTLAPITAEDESATLATLRAYGYEGEVTWRSFAEHLEAVHHNGTAPNLVWFVGHTALRQAAVNDVRRHGICMATAIERHLREALDAGAIGFSSGLEYGAGRFAGTDELVSLARILASYGGMYASHIRNRDSELGPAIDEFFEVVHAGDIRAQVSHLNVRRNTGAAPDAWARAVDRMMEEQARGVDVLADMTPYPDGIGLATGILPSWLVDRAPMEAAQLLREIEVRERVRADSDRYWRFVHRGEWDRVRLAVCPATPEFEGLTFPEISHLTGKDEWECFFDILVAAGADIGAVQLLGELFEHEHVAEAVQHDQFLLGVDGYTSKREGPLAARTRHPLFFHGHTHFLAHHALREKTIPVETAIHKMTGAVASHFDISGRGLLAEGYFADVVAFDLEKLREIDTFAMPEQYATPARHVWVNGTATIFDGRHTYRRAGRHVRPRNLH
ncbi:amidohydrolase family protein [Rhodococcus sp. PSBB049]|uniref:N-acyl-D-amino-acid deacylase family protein n=1 Tax=Rhodococcus sp. PSBB049 TaxID=2812863 RepID=UPI00197E4580|nr:amidohydrolase family protein [Rhodococcus sp. PSBB049]QSE72362.1 amidohydrolase family protein [Rhodococcus sp. PSBB049]